MNRVEPTATVDGRGAGSQRPSGARRIGPARGTRHHVRVVLAVAHAVLRGWRNVLISALGTRTRYRVVTTSVLVVVVGGDLVVILASTRRAPSRSGLPPDFVYATLGAAAVGVGVLLAALAALLLPEHGEFDGFLATTRATASARALGEELPVLCAFLAMAAAGCVPLTTASLDTAPSAGHVVLIGVGCFLVVAFGLFAGRLLHALAIRLLVVVGIPAGAGRPIGAGAMIALAVWSFATLRPKNSDAPVTGLRRFLAGVYDGGRLTPVTTGVLVVGCAVMIGCTVLLPAPRGRAGGSGGPRWFAVGVGAGSAVSGRPFFAVTRAVLSCALREPGVRMWVGAASLAPAAAAFAQGVTGIAFTGGTAMLLALPGLLAAFVHGVTRGLRTLLGTTGRTGRQTFAPVTIATVLLVAATLVAEYVVALLVTDLSAGTASAGLALCAVSFGVALLLGHLLPVRADGTSWVTLEMLAFAVTVLLVVVVIRQPVLPVPIALATVAVLGPVGGVAAARSVERRRAAVD
ncbi:hypothetical protein [Streptomyces sp. SID3343]|uniref:hypothetical protein n=1 Tax=Streptomyces sp. SID3343 TaxID=2690260 RepID=UPI00136B37E0|nr:hypothetical protein [Streptomyces sp. SID3343]